MVGISGGGRCDQYSLLAMKGGGVPWSRVIRENGGDFDSVGGMWSGVAPNICSPTTDAGQPSASKIRRFQRRLFVRDSPPKQTPYRVRDGWSSAGPSLPTSTRGRSS